MIVCVLGMHKSGTTLVAETLHHSGVHMAEVPDDLGYDDANKYERHEAQRLNRRLLVPTLVPTWKGHRRRNDGLDRAGYEINLDSLAWVRRRRLEIALSAAETLPIEELVSRLDGLHDHWGFKDPRTCLTYAWWRRALPAHSVVVVYRPLDEVLLRYRVRNTAPIRLIRVARNWIVHNELLVEHLDRSDNAVVLRYDALMSSDLEFARLGDHLGLTLVDRRRPELYRARRTRPGHSPVHLPRTLRRRAIAVEQRLELIRAHDD